MSKVDAPAVRLPSQPIPASEARSESTVARGDEINQPDPDSFVARRDTQTESPPPSSAIALERPVTLTTVDKLVRDLSSRDAYAKLMALPSEELSLALRELVYVDRGKTLSRYVNGFLNKPQAARSFAKRLDEDLRDPFVADALAEYLDPKVWGALLRTGQSFSTSFGGADRIKATLAERERFAEIEGFLISNTTHSWLEGADAAVVTDGEAVGAHGVLVADPALFENLLARVAGAETGRLWNRLVDNLPDTELRALVSQMATQLGTPARSEILLNLAPENLERLLAAAEGSGVKAALITGLGGEDLVAEQLEAKPSLLGVMGMLREAATETYEVQQGTAKMSAADRAWLAGMEDAITRQDAHAVADLLETAGPKRYWALWDASREMNLPELEPGELRTEQGKEAWKVNWNLTKGDDDRMIQQVIRLAGKLNLTDGLMQTLSDTLFFRKEFWVGGDGHLEGGSTYGILPGQWSADHPSRLGTFTANDIESAVFRGEKLSTMTYRKAPHFEAKSPPFWYRWFHGANEPQAATDNKEEMRGFGNADNFKCLVRDANGKPLIILATGGFGEYRDGEIAMWNVLPFHMVLSDYESAEPVFGSTKATHSAMMALEPSQLAAKLERLGADGVDRHIATLMRRDPWNVESTDSYKLVEFATKIAEAGQGRGDAGTKVSFATALTGLSIDSNYQLVRAVLAMEDPALVKGFRAAVGDEVFRRLVSGTKADSITGRALLEGELPARNATGQFKELAGLDELPLPAGANRHQYLFLKGFLGDDLGGYMENVEGAMTDWGIEPSRISFAKYNTAISSLLVAAEIAQQINAKHAETGDQVILVGHSMGGPHAKSLLAGTREEYLAAVQKWNVTPGRTSEETIGTSQANENWTAVLAARERVAGNFLAQPAMQAQIAKDIVDCHELDSILAATLRLAGGNRQAFESMAAREVEARFPGERYPTVVLATDSDGELSLMPSTEHYYRKLLGTPSDGAVPAVDQWAVNGAAVVYLPNGRDHMAFLSFEHLAEHFAVQLDAGEPDETVRGILDRLHTMAGELAVEHPALSIFAGLLENADASWSPTQCKMLAAALRKYGKPLDELLTQKRAEALQDNLDTAGAVPAMLSILLGDIEYQ